MLKSRNEQSMKMEFLLAKNKNIHLDSRLYEVEFLDGSMETLSSNIVAENLLSQVDQDGHREMLLDEIIDHQKDATALSDADSQYTINGIPRSRYTTIGWSVLVRWKDGSCNWVSLKDFKDSFPVQLAEYATRVGIQNEPAFRWWIPFTIKKRQSIINKLKSKYWQISHKYGHEIPKSIADAKRIDTDNKNTLWQDAIQLEMTNNRVAFQLYNGDPTNLQGYKAVETHLIFDIKLGENFRRKARCVEDGRRTATP